MLASYRAHEMRVTRCANAGPVSLAHKGLPLPHCMQDILPSNLRKNFSYLAFWPCSITASHSKTVSQSGPLMKLTHIMSKFFWPILCPRRLKLLANHSLSHFWSANLS